MGRPALDISVLRHTYTTWKNLGEDTSKTAEAVGVSVPTVYDHLRRYVKQLIASGANPEEVSPKRGRKSRPAPAPPVSRLRKPELPVTEKKPSATEELEDVLLWDAYAKDPSTFNRNKIAEFYWKWATQEVEKFCARRHLQPDAYYAPVSEALLLSIPRFDRSRGFAFRTFAYPRLTGALLDQCREEDHASRVQRARFKQRLQAEERVGGSPDAVKQALNWNDDEYRSSLIPFVRSIDTPIQYDNTPQGTTDNKTVFMHDRLGKSDRRRVDVDDALREMMRGCQLHEIVILYLLYHGDWTMKKIGESLGLSESRISQVHSDAIKRMREKGWDHLVELAVG